MSPHKSNSIVPQRLHGSDDGYKEFNQQLETDPRFQGLEVEKLSEWWRIMFYDTHRGNIESGLRAVERSLKWRQAYRWYKLPEEDFSAEVATGKLYFHKTDKEGNPVLMWRMSRHEASKDADGIERTVRFLIWTMEKAIRKGLIKRKVTVILDRLDITSDNNEGIQFIRSAITNIQTNLPEIIHKVVIFPTNMVLYAVWKVAKNFLDPRVVGKVALCGNKEYKETLGDIIDPHNLPMRYGGKSVDPLDEPGWEKFAQDFARNGGNHSLDVA